MKTMMKVFRLVIAAVMLLSCFLLPSAFAEDEVATITLNVTNTPVRGDVMLEKTGLRLTGFSEEQDEYGNTVMRPVYENGYLEGAVFELRAAEDIVGKEGTVFFRKDDLVEELTTSSLGAIKSQVLPLGNYYLKEIGTVPAIDVNAYLSAIGEEVDVLKSDPLF